MNYEPFPIDISASGHWVDELFWLAFALTGITFLVVIGLLAFMFWRYREQPGRKAYYTHGDSPGAVFMTFGLALLVFLLIDVNLAWHDHLAWKKVWGVPPNSSRTLRVEVMGEQFAWNIRYAGPDEIFGTPDDVTTINQFHVPVNKPVVVQIGSKDVIHSFFLPNLRIKQDAVPGMVTNLTFEVRKPGTYDVACAEHCGFGHYRMNGFLIAEEPQAFEAWLTQQDKDETPDLSWGWEWKKRR